MSDTENKEEPIHIETSWILTGIDFNSCVVQLSRMNLSETGCLSYISAELCLPEIRESDKNKYYLGQGFTITIDSSKECDNKNFAYSDRL